MGAIEACRTPRLGGHVDACDGCGLTRVSYNSCRNRHCPKCQGAARQQWVAARVADLLPVPHFHVVFTLPPAIAEIAFQNKAVVYTLLMRISAETLQTIAANPRWLGAEIGVTAVLHTWGQAMTHHPHVHCVVPGGGLSQDRHQHSPGRSARAILFPVRYIMIPNTRCFQDCYARPKRSPSARYHASVPCQMAGSHHQYDKNSNNDTLAKGPEWQSAASKLIVAITQATMPSVTTMPGDPLFP